jgi:hypothetical protein
LELEQRMLQFAAIYNVAAMLRDSWHGSAARRLQCAERLAEVLAAELQRGSDRPFKNGRKSVPRRESIFILPWCLPTIAR